MDGPGHYLESPQAGQSPALRSHRKQVCGQKISENITIAQNAQIVLKKCQKTAIAQNAQKKQISDSGHSNINRPAGTVWALNQKFIFFVHVEQ